MTKARVNDIKPGGGNHSHPGNEYYMSRPKKEGKIRDCSRSEEWK